jgi:hypothetical protein
MVVCTTKAQILVYRSLEARVSKIIAPLQAKVSGRVARIDVLERGIIVKSLKGFNNLILNQGLDSIGVRKFSECFIACAVGTGNTAPANNQTALVAEAARTATYLTGVGNCGTTRNSATRFTMRRTFDFPVGALNGNYTELGFSWSAGANGNLFSRVLIQSAGSPISLAVTSAQQLRVVYELYVDFVAGIQNVNTNFGGAWGVVLGTAGIQNTQMTINNSATDAPISTVETSGISLTQANGTAGTFLEPVMGFYGYLCSTNEPLLAVGSAANRTAVILKSVGPSAYTNGNYYRDVIVSFSVNEANGPIGSLALSGNGSPDKAVWAFVMNAIKTKLNTETLSFTIRKSWGRL